MLMGELGNPLSPGDITPTYGDSAGLTTMAGRVVGLIRNVAVIGGVIILMILGVKYMLGSTEEIEERNIIKPLGYLNSSGFIKLYYI